MSAFFGAVALCGDDFVELVVGDGVHGVEAVEGIAAVEEGPFVEVSEGFFGVVAGEGGATEEYGEGDILVIEFVEIVFHDGDGLDEEAGHSDGVGVFFVGGFEDVGDGLFDTEVEDGIAVVGEDDIDEVFSDVVDVAFDGGEDDAAFGGALGFLHEGLEVTDGGFHGFRGLEYEGELHLSGAEEFADDFHAFEEDIVDDVEGLVFLAGEIEVEGEVAFFADDDVAFEEFFDGEVLVGGVGVGGFVFVGVGEEGDEACEGVAVVAAVVDEVEGGEPLGFGDAVFGEDFGGVGDGGGESCVAALV